MPNVRDRQLGSGGEGRRAEGMSKTEANKSTHRQGQGCGCVGEG